MKQIKFDLPIDGTKVRTIEELRDHFSTEILDLYKNGLLLKWLTNQRYASYAQAVERLLPTETDANLLKLLCGIFEVDVDIEIIQQLADYHGSGIKIDPEQLRVKKSSESLPFDKPYSNPRQRGYYWFNDEYVPHSMNLAAIESIHKSITGEDIHLVPVIIKFSIPHDREYSSSESSHSMKNNIDYAGDLFGSDFNLRCGVFISSDFLSGLTFNIKGTVNRFRYRTGDTEISDCDFPASFHIDGWNYGTLYKKISKFHERFEYRDSELNRCYKAIVAYLRIDI